jgi:predicted RNA binding protein YcfA (HicA-like mRNA interferase family)
MPPFGPIKRKELIRYLKASGFSGPYSRGKHQHMKNGDLTLILPNPHQGDIGRPLLDRILKQAGISRDEWEKL